MVVVIDGKTLSGEQLTYKTSLVCTYKLLTCLKEALS